MSENKKKSITYNQYKILKDSLEKKENDPNYKMPEGYEEYQNATGVVSGHGGKYYVTWVDEDGNSSPATTVKKASSIINNDVNKGDSINKRVLEDFIGQNIKADFFNLYKLPKYSTDSNYSSSGFMPIYLKSSKMNSGTGGAMGVESDGFIDFGESIEIVLPWDPKDIQDSVQVGYSRNFDEGLMGNLASSLSVLAGDVGGLTVNSIADNFMINYDAKSLKKELKLDFVLPLTHMDNITEQWTQTAREYLGQLQGLVYPRSMVAFVPPLMSVRLGHMYRGFKGFVSSVSINQSSDYTTTPNTNGDMGKVTWPTVITGSISFINVFNYFWGGDMQALNLEEFNLSKSPALLFGIYNSTGGTGASVSGGAKTGTEAGQNDTDAQQNSLNQQKINNTNNNNYLSQTSNEIIKDANDATNNIIDAGEDLTNLENSYKSMTMDDASYSYFNKNDSNSDIRNYFAENGITDEIIDNNTKYITGTYGNNLNFIDYDTLEYVGMTNSNSKLQLANQLQNTVGEFTDISKYSEFIASTIKNEDWSKIVESNDLVKTGLSILNSNNNIIATNNTGISNVFQSITSGKSDILSIVKKGITLYNNIDNLVDDIQNIDSINDFGSAVYGAMILNNNISKLTNGVNSNINSNNELYNNINKGLGTIGSISNAASVLVGSEQYTNINNYVNVIDNLFDKANELLGDNKMNKITYEEMSKVKENTKNLDTDTLTTLNEKIYSYYTEIMSNNNGSTNTSTPNLLDTSNYNLIHPNINSNNIKNVKKKSNTISVTNNTKTI